MPARAIKGFGRVSEHSAQAGGAIIGDRSQARQQVGWIRRGDVGQEEHPELTASRGLQGVAEDAQRRDSFVEPNDVLCAWQSQIDLTWVR